MPNIIYCAKCGIALATTRKALPKYGRIIDIIEPHECDEELHDIELIPVAETPRFVPKEEHKLIQKLNQLSNAEGGKLASFGGISTSDLRDRREEQDVKSTAPRSIIDDIMSGRMKQSSQGPERNIPPDPEEQEDE